MTVHVVIPVFNRLTLTQSLVTCLRNQHLDENLNILVVDDGSTDGSSEWLLAQNDIETLHGDGSLFWGGAIDKAFQHLMDKASFKDWILLINNDTKINHNFIQCLLDIARQYSPAAVGSVICDELDLSRLLSIGVSIDSWRLKTKDLIEQDACLSSFSPIAVDALSGRGVIFPMESLKASGGMRPKFLPHYLADYELSLRVKRYGWKLLVAREAIVYSSDDYGSMKRNLSWGKKLFSVRSPQYLPAMIIFWWEASNFLQKITLPFRVILFMLFPNLRK
jgi:glycosyltransferase involved in cell wall biosynthesis